MTKGSGEGRKQRRRYSPWQGMNELILYAWIYPWTVFAIYVPAEWFLSWANDPDTRDTNIWGDEHVAIVKIAFWAGPVWWPLLTWLAARAERQKQTHQMR